MLNPSLATRPILLGFAAIACMALASVPAAAKGSSSAHISAQGSINSNAPGSLDRDLGKDRAEDRANLHANLGANKPGFCPPGQAKKAGRGSRFKC